MWIVKDQTAPINSETKSFTTLDIYFRLHLWSSLYIFVFDWFHFCISKAKFNNNRKWHLIAVEIYMWRHGRIYSHQGGCICCPLCILDIELRTLKVALQWSFRGSCICINCAKFGSCYCQVDQSTYQRFCDKAQDQVQVAIWSKPNYLFPTPSLINSTVTEYDFDNFFILFTLQVPTNKGSRVVVLHPQRSQGKNFHILQQSNRYTSLFFIPRELWQ